MMFRRMYDKPAVHAAIKELQEFLHPRGISLAEASLRWIYYHSALGDSDGLILGASRAAQVQQNVKDISKGLLEQDVRSKIDGVWMSIKSVTP